MGTSVALAQAGDVSSKFRAADQVTIPATETVDHDVYAAGGTITVDGTINGDLVATAAQILVNGTVTGDVLAAGGSVTIGGTVDGDARLAGGTISVGGTITEDLAMAGGTLALASTGTVGEDLILSGGTATISGSVAGNAVGGVGSYSRTGTIGGSDMVQVGGTPGAAPPPPPRTAADMVADAIRQWLSVLLVGAIALWLAPRGMTAMAAAVRDRPLPVVGWGVAGIIGFIVLLIIIVIIVTLLAIILGLLGFGPLAALGVFSGVVAFLGVIVSFAFVTGFLADAIVGLALAHLVSTARPLADPERDRGRQFLWLAVGAAIVVILSSLPVIGPWVKLIVVIVGLGAFLYALWRRRRREPPPVWAEPPPTVPPPAPATPA